MPKRVDQNNGVKLRRRQCISCGGNMRSVRVDARLCSPACRSREYRKRQKKAQVNAKTSR